MLQEYEYFESERLFHGLVPSVLGSKLDVMFLGRSRDESLDLWSKMCQLCRDIASILNGEDPQSELGRFNDGKMLSHSPVSDTLADAVDLCKEYLWSTSGLFDPAFGKMSFVDHDEEDGSLSLYGVRLDLGSFSRGYLMRKCQELVLGAGVENAFLNLGNCCFVAAGHHPYGNSWKVSLTNPFSRMPLEDIDLVDCALALSCNAPGSLGRVVDPSTGKGCEQRRMAVAIAADALDAKVLSTSLMVSGDSGKLAGNFPEADMRIYNL